MSLQDLSHEFFTFGLMYSTFLSIFITIRGLYRWTGRRNGLYYASRRDTVSLVSAERHGEQGERLVDDALCEAGIPTLRNLFLHDPGGQMTELDLVALVGKTLLVIEVKAWAGEVVGDANDMEWTQKKNNGALKLLKNPLHQNQHHLRALRTVLPKARSAGIVVFTESRFPDGLPDGVVDLSGLLQLIEQERKADPDAATVLGWGKLSVWSMRQNKRQLQEALITQIHGKMAAVGNYDAPRTNEAPA